MNFSVAYSGKRPPAVRHHVVSWALLYLLCSGELLPSGLDSDL